MVTSATANNRQADTLRLSKRLSTASGAAAALALAQISEARQQPRIATPALLVRPCKTTNTISATNASAHTEYTVSVTIASRCKSLSCSLIPEDYADSLQQYQNVEKETPILYVIKVVSQLTAGVLDRGAVGEIDLGPAGDPWPDPVPLGVIRYAFGQIGDEEWAFRARSDKTHVAA